MKIKTFLALVFFSFLYIYESVAQEYVFTSKNKKALKYYYEAEIAYKQKELKTAETALFHSLKYDSEFIEAWLLLGDVSTEVRKTVQAIDAYQKAVKIDPEFFPPVYYFLGNLYYADGKYEEAFNAYESFLAMQTNSGEQRALATLGLKKSTFAMAELQNPKTSVPEEMGANINTAFDEYINFVNEGLNGMIFTRKIMLGKDATGNPLFRESIFDSEKTENYWGKAKELTLTWQEGLDIGGMNLAVDGRKMYFTGCNWPSNYGSCDMYVSFKEGNNWELPFNLGDKINSQWWDSQPAISSDGKKLYFASKRAGGKGGSDIWMSVRLANGKWSLPLNLGDSINTPGDEMSPFIHADGKTLYFSTNGRMGLGGFDLFVSKQNAAGVWSDAKNLGYPINSSADEINIFLSIEGQSAWISSDRKGGEGGFDIYSFPTYPAMQPQSVFYIKGTVSDLSNGKKLQAKIELTNLLTGLVDDSASSDPVNGEFLLVLHPGVNYAFHINKKGYLFYSENYNLSDSINAEFVAKDFRLSPLKQGNFFVLNNIFFDFNSAVLKSSSNNELNKLADMLLANKEVNILIEGHTDNIGSDEYNLKLSSDRAKSVADYLTSKGIGAERIMYEGIGSSRPVESNLTEEGRAKNRRTEVIVL